VYAGRRIMDPRCAAALVVKPMMKLTLKATRRTHGVSPSP